MAKNKTTKRGAAAVATKAKTPEIGQKRKHSNQGSGSSQPELKKAKSEPQKFEHEVFVSKLNKTTTKETIEEYFSKYGKVLSVTLPLHRKDNPKNLVNRTFAFVAFSSASEKDAVLAVDHKLEKFKLVVKDSKDPSKGNSKAEKVVEEEVDSGEEEEAVEEEEGDVDEEEDEDEEDNEEDDDGEAESGEEAEDEENVEGEEDDDDDNDDNEEGEEAEEAEDDE
ncbi:glutamic acid-rich protein isoform X2 [Hyalella azteca]|nr:glutamic acid-rich protein isoform X2 [Hyalella azteca]XP_018025528.1 glutamic acid-rich protein isoform X2 [Hyalella azteca]